MKKGKYRARFVNSVDPEKVVESCSSKALVAIDVAKVVQYATFFDSESGEALETVRWSHPGESREFFGLCVAFGSGGVVLEAAMEPTGTYGDALRVGLQSRGIPVYQVSGKRVKDASELGDGVPSTHDSKATHTIGWLHRQGLSTLWPLRDENEREAAAACNILRYAQEREERGVNRLEPQLARHWPEVGHLLKLKSAALLALLAEFGSPADVARAPADARGLLRRVGRSFLGEERIADVVNSASSTLGVPMTPTERKCIQVLARDIQEAGRARREAEKDVQAQCQEEVPQEVVAFIGGVTAAVLVAHGLSAPKYDSAKAFLKALGLNLCEYSSGQKQGGLHISKRGASMPRQLLYMAALRGIKDDPWVRAWYAAKRQRDGGDQKGTGAKKTGVKGVIAVERKLVMALWHVWNKQEPFDATRLFDTARLKRVEAAPCSEAA